MCVRNSVKLSVSAELKRFSWLRIFVLLSNIETVCDQDAMLLAEELLSRLPRNRLFSYSEKESGSNDISLHLVEFSNVHDCDEALTSLNRMSRIKLYKNIARSRLLLMYRNFLSQEISSSF